MTSEVGSVTQTLVYLWMLSEAFSYLLCIKWVALSKEDVFQYFGRSLWTEEFSFKAVFLDFSVKVTNHLLNQVSLSWLHLSRTVLNRRISLGCGFSPKTHWVFFTILVPVWKAFMTASCGLFETRLVAECGFTLLVLQKSNFWAEPLPFSLPPMNLILDCFSPPWSLGFVIIETHGFHFLFIPLHERSNERGHYDVFWYICAVKLDRQLPSLSSSRK